MPAPAFPFAESRPGPEPKTGYPGDTRRYGRGVVVHSAEGMRSGMMNVLRGSAPKSWHFSVLKDGEIWQHYPLEAVTWHAGKRANVQYAGIECEGFAGEPLTERQFAGLANLILWIAQQERWPEAERSVTLWEHSQFRATACPSGRIPWQRLINVLGRPPWEYRTPWDSPAPEPAPAPDHLWTPLIDRQIRGLTAAAFILTIGQPLSDLGEQDREAVRSVAAQL